MMRTPLLHVISGLRRGGAEQALVRLAEYGLAHSFDLHVLSLEDEGVFGARLRAAGATVHSLGVRSSPLSALSRLPNLVKLIQPRVIQGWMYHGNVGASAAARTLGTDVPVFWNVRQGLDDINCEKRLTRAVIRLNRRLSRHADCIIYNSHRSREQHEAFGFSSIKGRVIPSGFDLRSFACDPAARLRIRTELRLDDSPILVGHFARLHPMKDHACLLQAANQALVHGLNLRFVIAGEGVSPKSIGLQTYVDRRFHANFHIFGDRADVPALMQAIDIYISSSQRAEGFPNVIGEAMAAAKPCIGTDVGDTAYVVGDCGFVIPPSNPSALAEGLARLARAPALRSSLGAAAKHRVEQYFDIQQVVSQYIELYASASRWGVGSRCVGL